MPRISAALPALLLPLALTACQGGPRLPDDYDLSGTISGEWRENAALRLNLVGAGFPQAVTSTSNLPQKVFERTAQGWTYGVDLPQLPGAAGVYKVIAFDDQNGDAAYTIGEPLAQNRQYLIFSLHPGDFAGFSAGDWLSIPAMQVSRGWNLYDAAQPIGAGNPRPVQQVSGYDLQRQP